MPQMPLEAQAEDLPKLIRKHKRIILGELKERSLWLIRLRWLVPPGIVAGAIFARLIGIEFRADAVIAVAAFILIYNVVHYMLGRRIKDEAEFQENTIRRFTYWQVGFDYAAMSLLIHFTGGVASPLIFFFIFHIIFASILLPSLSAYGFAALAAAGMSLIAAGEHLGWIPMHTMFFHGEPINLAYQPLFIIVELGFFTASVFITAFIATSVMGMLRKRIIDLAELSEMVTMLNNRLNSLYAVTQAIGSVRNLENVLHIVTSELAAVMAVEGISVKLLSEDNKFLRYVAVHGESVEIFKSKVVEVARSPVNRRIIEGEPFAIGQLTERDKFQFGQRLIASRVQSVLFVPLHVEGRVIGILGAYCIQPERFKSEDVDFFRLAAGLVAIALDNARSYEAIENLVKEKSWFMMKVAHNLRSPLSAIISILDIVREGFYGELNAKQQEYLRRVDRRAWTMSDMISELMTLAESKRERPSIKLEPVSPATIAGRVQRTFQEQADEKKIQFTVTVGENLHDIHGDPALIEQALENLVSNAIKYTHSGEKVSLSFSQGNENTVRIEVADNGIGIPKADMPRLFTEFFRADNAREVDEIGTGLGLAIVKEIVDQHNGRIVVESEEGFGTIFVVHLPVSSLKEAEDEHKTD